MNDRRSQILYEKQRWAAKRAAVYNERIEPPSVVGQRSAHSPEFNVRPDGTIVGGKHEAEASETSAGSVRRMPTDPETEAQMQSRGDLLRFSLDGFVFKMIRTTILRDTIKNLDGWEIYNDRGLLSDWFYEDDADGNPRKHAEETLGAKLAGRQKADAEVDAPPVPPPI